MRILHFIPEITDNRDVRKEFFRHLFERSEGIEMRILTTDDDTGIENAEKISTLMPFVGKKVGAIMDEFHPEILHIHGCTGHTELKVLNAAEDRHIPIIVSPSGNLAAITLNERSPLKQLTSDASRARKMLNEADAIHVTGGMEKETVEKLQIIPGKENNDISRKMVVIKNSVLTNSITDEDMRADFASLYRKIIDRRAYDVMLPETKQLELLLLRTGVNGMYCNRNSSDDELVKSVTAEEMNKIFIHAETEDIRDFIDAGCVKYGITFCPDRKLCRERAGLPDDMKRISLSDNIEKIKSKNYKILRDFENYKVEQELYCFIACAQDMLEKHTLTLRHLAELNDILINTEYREDIVDKLFRDSKIYDFAARLMQAAHEYVALPEGFMPVTPINDKKTIEILTFLTLKSR